MKAGLTILFLCGFATFSVMVKNELRSDKSPIGTLRIGEDLQDFTLADTTGQEFTLSEITRGNKLVVINFWASWCAPCRLEMPDLEKLYTSKKGDGLIVLGINEDEEREAMDAYLSKKPVSFPVLLDHDGALMKRFGARALPTTILVGGDGKILRIAEGLQTYLQYEVDIYLKPGPASK